MEQVYTPNILVKAIPGWCLKYVDDAGNAPNRTATARYAWEVERNAGRIRTSTIPENVWLVGWLDFTAGMYQTYGHVFLFKRTGNSYQIYDSEVQSGQRKPYGSLKELLAWFGAYKPKYIGWSTHCDGREYAKEATMSKASETEIIYLLRGITGEEPPKSLVDAYYGNTYEYCARDMIANVFREGHDYLSYVGWSKKEFDRMNNEIASLKKQLAEKPTGDFIKVSELYIKKG